MRGRADTPPIKTLREAGINAQRSRSSFRTQACSRWSRQLASSWVHSRLTAGNAPSPSLSRTSTRPSTCSNSGNTPSACCCFGFVAPPREEEDFSLFTVGFAAVLAVLRRGQLRSRQPPDQRSDVWHACFVRGTTANKSNRGWVLGSTTDRGPRRMLATGDWRCKGRRQCHDNVIVQAGSASKKVRARHAAWDAKASLAVRAAQPRGIQRTHKTAAWIVDRSATAIAAHAAASCFLAFCLPSWPDCAHWSIRSKKFGSRVRSTWQASPSSTEVSSGTRTDSRSALPSWKNSKNGRRLSKSASSS